jgi:hypothetical protein
MTIPSRILRCSILLAIGVLLIQQAAVASAYRARPAPAQNDTAAWTVMIYMAGDNDLEGFALGDLNEMEFSGSTPQVNIVAELDRSEMYDSSLGNWTDARRYYITPDASTARLNSTEVGDVGEIDTGDPNSKRRMNSGWLAYSGKIIFMATSRLINGWYAR